MISISLDHFIHKDKACVAIKFPYRFETKEYVKQFKGVYWTKTHRTFYIYKESGQLEELVSYLKNGGYAVLGNAEDMAIRKAKYTVQPLGPLTAEKKAIYRHFIEFLEGKRFSKSTVTTYGHFVQEFLRFTKDTPVNELDQNDIRLFIEWTVGTLNYSVSTHRQLVSGLRHFAYFYPACAIDVEKIYMPKKDRKLPVVLSMEEVLSLIQATKNLKHRVVIAMLYASGLRIGELLRLQLKDFDFNRNQLHIRNAKGRKDRYATIAKSLHPLLKNYHATYRPHVYFIENPKGGMYSPTSIRSFLKKSCELAGITKTVTPHSLRHSYATHLLEQGTDIRYIQELLGHSRPETTMIYTHVAEKDLREIKSPLDISLKKLSLPDNDDGNLLLSP